MNYIYVKDISGFDNIIKSIKKSSWIALDLEFTQYNTAIALIQLAWDGGAAIVDPLKVRNISSLVEIMESPQIIKIVHAGMNDFSMLYKYNNCQPKNIFDTQVAAAFLNYAYPSSLDVLVKAELGIRMEKGLAVSDWRQRPLSQKQLNYAIADVEHLHALYISYSSKMKGSSQYNWFKEEMKNREDMSADEEMELLKHCSFIDKLRHKKKAAFLFRLLDWRQKVDSENPREFLSNKSAYEIVRIINGGQQAIEQNYKLKKNIRTRYCSEILSLWDKPIGPEEQEMLDSLPRPREMDTDLSILSTFLFSYLQYQGEVSRINYRIVGSKKDIDNLLQYGDHFTNKLTAGWRLSVLGPDFKDWINFTGALSITMNRDSLVIKKKS